MMAHPEMASNSSTCCATAMCWDMPSMNSSGDMVLNPEGSGGMPIGIVPGCIAMPGCATGLATWATPGCAMGAAIGAAAATATGAGAVGTCTWNCCPGARPSGICAARIDQSDRTELSDRVCAPRR